MKYTIKHRLGDTTNFWLKPIQSFRTNSEHEYTSIIIDIWIDGSLKAPKGVLVNNPKEFDNWLNSLVGQIIEIEDTRPLIYSTRGSVSLCES